MLINDNNRGRVTMPKSPASSQRKAVKPAPKPKARAAPPKKPTLGGVVPLPDVPRLGMSRPMPQAPSRATGPQLGMGHMSNASNPLGQGGVGAGQVGGLQPTVRGTMPSLSGPPTPPPGNPIGMPAPPTPPVGRPAPMPTPPGARPAPNSQIWADPNLGKKPRAKPRAARTAPATRPKPAAGAGGKGKKAK